MNDLDPPDSSKPDCDAGHPGERQPLLIGDAPTDDALDTTWSRPPGITGWLSSVQNDVIGLRLILTGLFFLLLGGSVDSVVMRLQLAVPENDLVGPQLYNEMFTNHGSVTMFLVILPIFEGFAILLLPLMLGTREMPFPRLGAFAYYTFLFGGLLYYSSTLFSAVPDAGWFGYTPLSGPEFSPDLALDFWVLGLGVAEVGAIAAAIEIIIAIMKMRAPGMTLLRMPLFVWAFLVTSFMILFAFTPLIVGSLLLELDRGFGTQFFNPDAGGSSLLWQHLFWIFGHPEVYIQFLPATGIVSMIVPVFSRARTVGYSWIVGSFVAIAFLSFGLWAHHMFTTGLPTLVLSFFAAASMVIAIPAGVQIFAWLSTMVMGVVRWSTPMLFVAGFLVMLVIGGVTGVMVAAVPFDAQAHDSYFVVGHLHYVLIGGVVLPIFAGVYYWFPKFVGRMLDERLGRIHFWLMMIGANVAFFPMHIVGLMGMPRRVYTYPAGLGWGPYNFVSTVGVFIMMAAIAVFGWNLFRSRKWGEEAGPNPWNADTLEWSTPSPPLQHGFTRPPIITSRHPLWDQDDLFDGDPRVERIAEGIAAWPLDWRANLTVTSAEAEPEELVRISGPSMWPLVAAVGAVAIFAAELLKLRAGALAGALLVVVAVVFWNRPDAVAMTEAEEDEFEENYGIAVRTGGSSSVDRWGMGLAILFAAIAFATFELAYFYLRLENEMWPPESIASPDLGAGARAGLAIVLGAAAVAFARARLAASDQRGLRIGLGAALVFGVAAGATVWIDLATAEFDSMTHAYGSIVHSLGGFLIVVVMGAALGTAAVLWWSRGDRFSPRRDSPVLNVFRFWLATAAVWIAGLATLYLGPVLT